MAAEAQLERELDRLYQLVPSDFTAARDELAGRLRSEDRRELAEQVKKLRKPSVAVWLVNRLARERELEVQRLAKIGEALADGQAALAGGDADAFVEARRAEERALGRLTSAAREIAEREGVGAAAIPRATATLRAASLSEDGRELLRRGRLTEELEPPGFEALAGLTGATPQPRPKRQTNVAPEREQERRREREQARERVRRARAEERKLAGAAQAARRKADQAAKRAADLEARADEAEAAAAAATEERLAAESELERRS